MFDFKNAPWEEAAVEYKRIAREMGDDQFFTKKELRHLPEVLQDGEQVLAFSSGLMDANTWLITLTNRRIIFLDKGMIFGLKQTVIPLNKVNAISGKTGLMFGEIAIADGAGQHVIKQVWKKTVAPFTAKALEAIDTLDSTSSSTPKDSPENDRYSQLERLAALKNAGVLSEEEFVAEKAKILSSK